MSDVYQMCVRCVMDTSDPYISFDGNGVCNHCALYAERRKEKLFEGEAGKQELERIVSCIKQQCANRPYDCIAGISGGVDSTTVLIKAKELGLRTLVVHLDNGWNSELAVQNIHGVVERLGFPLMTHVIDWEEFRDVQLAFVRSGVPNLEIPTDHAIVACLFRAAATHHVPWILSGGNVTSEAIMPDAWGYDPKDLRHLKAINRRFGGPRRFKTFPTLSLRRLAWQIFVHKVRFFPVLNYIDYNKEQAKRHLIDKYGWRDYGGKHFESIWTRFFQGYILPRKHGFDKRRAHYSALINAGQMSREDALHDLERPPYDKELMQDDRVYVIKKFGIDEGEFEDIMRNSVNSENDYPNSRFIMEWLPALVQLARRTVTGR